MNYQYAEALVDVARGIRDAIQESSARLSQDIQRLTLALEKSKMAERDALERLKAAVERNGNLQQSAVTMIQGFAAEIRKVTENSAGGDAEDVSNDLNALADQMDQQAAAFSEAMTANTPSQA